CTLTARAEEQAATLAAELARRLPDFDARELHFNLAHHSSHYYRNGGFDALPDDGALRVVERARLRPAPRDWLPCSLGRPARRALRDACPPSGCEAIARTVFVAPDLTVFPCSIWEAPLGNLRDHDLSLERLLAQPVAAHARATIERRACPGCFTPCEAAPAML